MAFARWDPVGDLLALQRQLDRFSPDTSGWVPPVDLHETADRYVLVAELPGLQPGDARIAVHDGRLTLSGARREGPACQQYHRIERGHGAFSRTFQLPLPVDVDAITADLQDGVLTVTVPKIPDAPRRIRIS